MLRRPVFTLGWSKRAAGENSMARRGGGDELKWVLGIAAVCFLYYKLAGQGKNNALLIPDTIEDRIDRVVDELNTRFGQRWVSLTASVLHSHIVRTMPALAALVNAVHRAELAYLAAPKAGRTKKQAALNQALGRG